MCHKSLTSCCCCSDSSVWCRQNLTWSALLKSWIRTLINDRISQRVYIDFGHIWVYLDASNTFFFFIKFLADTCPFWGHWYPCFGFLVTSPLGFKARVGSALFAMFAEANVMYIPQDSPLVLHLPTSWWPARSRSLPHMHVQRWDLAQIRTCNRTNRRRTRYHCASDPAICCQYFEKCHNFQIFDELCWAPCSVPRS